MPNKTFPFTDFDAELIAELARKKGCSQTQVLREAMRELRVAHGYYAEDAAKLLDDLQQHGEILTVKVAIDDVAVKVGDHTVDDAFGQAVPETNKPRFSTDFTDVYIKGEPDVRIYVGRVPSQGGTLTVPVSTLADGLGA